MGRLECKKVQYFQLSELKRVYKMIDSIKIENFRCFKETKITGFKQVNLLGGKNNAGKTSLLEALYLSNSPRSESISLLRRFRREDMDFAKSVPERAWDNFFFNQSRDHTITVSLSTDKSLNSSVEIYCDNSLEDFSKVLEDEELEKDLQDLSDLLSRRDTIRTTLHIRWCTDGRKFDVASIVAHSKGIVGRDMKIPDVKKVTILPASFALSSSALAEEYDKADLANHATDVLTVVKVIDNTISQLKTLTIGSPTLYLKRNSDSFLPISLFGEAITKVVTIVLKLINNKGSILLVDEIENGIHHSNQKDLWRTLFKLASTLDVQIFATTHSLEMLQAFTETGLEQGNENIGAYIELARNVRTGQISGIAHGLETLYYKLERRVGVRGE